MSDLDGRVFVKRAGRLMPADIHAQDWLDGVKEGREVMLTVRKPRNPRHHRLLFALLKLVTDNTDRWPSPDVLLDDLKLATGHCELRFNLLEGRPYMIPKSISFAAMDQDAFREWFDRAIDILAAKILLVESDVLRQEVLAMVESQP